MNIGVCALDRYLKKYDLYYLFDYSKSSTEKELQEYINQYYKTENNTRNYLDGKEIDIFIPEKNIGIEFNGNYWHSSLYKEKKYHYNKMMLANTTMSQMSNIKKTLVGYVSGIRDARAEMEKLVEELTQNH